jgi:hypothetical protein
MTRTPADVLRRVADVIEARGWTQGVIESVDGRVCVEGAFAVVFTMAHHGDLGVGVLNDHPALLVTRAHALLRSWLRGRELSLWNDGHEMTQYHLVNELRACAGAYDATDVATDGRRGSLQHVA